MTFLDLWESDSSFNTGGYSNPEYDKLIEAAKTESDPAGRMDLMEEAERIFIEQDAGCAPLFFQGRTWLVEPTIKGYWYHNYGGSLDLKLYRVGG
jgi:oligopeptide transport system substrate-binding protein